MSIDNFRQDASLKSCGSSNEEIYQTTINCLEKENLHTTQPDILDVGCGTGGMLSPLKELFPKACYTGTDISFFPTAQFTQQQFIKHDFNQDFTASFKKYDLIIALEVIEHLENPRHFVRQLHSLLKPDGKVVLSTPNPESYTSLLSYFIRGFHSAFGPRNYPAHINAVSLYDMKNIISEINSFDVDLVKFISNGRVPGTKLKWKNFMPILKGKRVSDNYLVIARKS